MIPDRKKQLRGDVLIIDDDVSICEILKGYCENMGCFRNILFAHDGSMASSKLRNQKFALILLDLKMPKKGGLDLLREMDDKSLNSKNNIVVVSGTLDKTMIEKIVENGVKAFLPKPFTEVEFQDKILKSLGLK
ncbi:MAG: response regulator [Bacteriovorax sp.]|nr:response regulator [Bacteriovorax sp.]